MLATEQHIVEPVETVACCDMLSNWKHIAKDSEKENDFEVSGPGSLATVDGMDDAKKPVELQSTHCIVHCFVTCLSLLHILVILGF